MENFLCGTLGSASVDILDCQPAGRTTEIPAWGPSFSSHSLWFVSFYSVSLCALEANRSLGSDLCCLRDVGDLVIYGEAWHLSSPRQDRNSASPGPASSSFWEWLSVSPEVQALAAGEDYQSPSAMSTLASRGEEGTSAAFLLAL